MFNQRHLYGKSVLIVCAYSMKISYSSSFQNLEVGCLSFNMAKSLVNQRTNGPVNAHLRSGSILVVSVGYHIIFNDSS